MAGISMIYQELDLVPQLTVEQNLFLGHAPRRFFVIDRRARRRRAEEALKRVGAEFSVDARLETLSVANQQLTAIARSLTMDAKIIIMDEPSAALNEHELKNVFGVIRELVRQGVAILYVSHRLHEIREIGDRVTILRGGRSIATFDVKGTAEETLVEAVIGQNRSLIERGERRSVTGAVALDVKRLAGPYGMDIRDLQVRWGEIVGLSGLNGSGRTTFLKALFGEAPFVGEVTLGGKRFRPRRPADAIARGVGLVPENRKTEGLVLDAAIYRNAGPAVVAAAAPAQPPGRKEPRQAYTSQPVDQIRGSGELESNAVGRQSAEGRVGEMAARRQPRAAARRAEPRPRRRRQGRTLRARPSSGRRGNRGHRRQQRARGALRRL